MPARLIRLKRRSAGVSGLRCATKRHSACIFHVSSFPNVKRCWLGLLLAAAMILFTQYKMKGRVDVAGQHQVELALLRAFRDGGPQPVPLGLAIFANLSERQIRGNAVALGVLRHFQRQVNIDHAGQYPAVALLAIAHQEPIVIGRRRGGMTAATTAVQAGLTTAAGIDESVHSATLGAIAAGPGRRNGMIAMAR